MYMSYESRLKALDLTILIERRLRGDMIQIYKIMQDIKNFDGDNCFQNIQKQVRGHCLKYFREIARQQHIQNFFLNRSANTCNSLPNDLVSSSSINSFKAHFDCLMSSNQKTRLS